MKTTTVSEKSYVAVEQALCPVCATEHDTGVIIHKQLKDVLEPKVVTHWQMCPEHEKLKDKGYIALVGIDPTRSEGKTMSGAFRTGNLAFLKAARWDDVFDVPAPEGGVCFTEDAVIDMLGKHQTEQNDAAETVSKIKQQLNN